MRAIFYRGIVALATAFISLSDAASGRVCYDSNRVQSQGSFACNPSADESFCCSIGNTCFSNGLCAPNSTQNLGETPYYTSTCTDSSYESGGCLQICNTNVTSGITGNGVQPCGDGDFCCWDLDRSDCCSTSSLVFNLGVATVVTHLTATPSATSIISSTISPSSSSSSRTSSSPTNTAAAVSSPTPSASKNNGSNSHVAVGVGLGVGVAAGILILGAALYFLRRQRKKKRATMGDPIHAPAVPFVDHYKQDSMAQNQRQAFHELSEDRALGELEGGRNEHEMSAFGSPIEDRK